MSTAAQQQPEPEFRIPSELFEALIRLKHDQPRRYQSNVSVGMQRRVEIYETLKREREDGSGIAGDGLQNLSPSE